MRILSYLNLSNPSNLEADSGFVFQRTLLREIAVRHQVYLIGPHGMDGLGADVVPIKTAFPETKFGVRFGFAYDGLKIALSALPACDILISNQTELAIPLLALCYEGWGMRIKCISYFHYLAIQGFNAGQPCYDPSLNVEGFGAAIWDRQKEAFIQSDINIIGSKFGKCLLMKALGASFDDAQISVLPPPAIIKAGNDQAYGHAGKRPVIVYNHRLYGHYGGVKLFEILARLYENHDFSLVITDPTFRRSGERNKLDNSVQDVREFLGSLPFVKLSHFRSQLEYGELLQEADFALGPLRVGALWSMAIVDAMSAGKPVIAFNDGAFAEVIQDEELLVSDEAGFRKVFIKLLTDESFRTAKGKQAREIAGRYDVRSIADKFERIFQHIMANK
ncbi:hypothetical protein BH09BAC6_BH09BAC6_08660 [soil metagenome]